MSAKLREIERLARARRGERGYVLLTLLLFISLMVIAAAAVLPDMIFQLKRDREEEMVHRGVQYARAVRRYYRKFGAYPLTLEQLDNVNHIRFLRKHYKDPIAGKDFKALHLMDVQTMFQGSGIQGAQTIGTPVAAMNGPVAASPAPSTNASTSASTGTTASSGTDTNSSGSSRNSSPFVTASGQPAGADMGGGPIVGVISTSTKESIRVYNKKNHYNDWFFAYDPASDRGGTITGPWQPVMAVAGLPPQTGLPGQPGLPGQYGSGFGQAGTGPGQLTPATTAPGTTPTPAVPPAGGMQPR
jgi:type II secretory pathway pseudopilin PulG